MIEILQLSLAAEMCSHLSKGMRWGLMSSVTVRLNAAEFSAAMNTIGEWLDANRYEPTRYKYDNHEDAIDITVDFTTELAAEAFAARFDGVCHSSVQPASPDSPRQLPA